MLVVINVCRKLHWVVQEKFSGYFVLESVIRMRICDP